MKEKLFPLMTLLLVVGTIGCGGIKNSMRLSEKNSAWNPAHQLTKERQEKQEKQEEEAQPVTMSAIWADSVYEKPGLPLVKGFGARIFFFDENHTKVKADGELIVYGFDESVKDKSESIADRKFVFPREKFQSHYSENDLGAAYSVWIPWEKTGGYRKSITLIPMFKTADGRLIKCPQAICTLPGKSMVEDLVAFDNEKKAYKVLGSSPAVVSQANYQSGTPLDTSDPKVAATKYEEATPVFNRVRTSTIQVNPGLARRMAQSGQPGNRNMVDPVKNRLVQPAIATETVAHNDFVPQMAASEKSQSNNGPNRLQKTTVADRPTFGQPAPWRR